MAYAKPTASISLDPRQPVVLHAQPHGDAGWDSYPSYLAQVLPLALAALSAQRLKATIFLVGHDAQEDRHRDLLGPLPQLGHEVGNHSQNHLQWLHRLPRPELEREIVAAEEAIMGDRGPPARLRGPGFACGRPCFRSWPSAATSTTARPSRPSSDRSRGRTTL